MFATAVFFPSLRFSTKPIPYFSAGVMISGMMFLIYAAWCFHKHKTTVNPLDLNQSTALVTDGPYRISRNPMYLGMMLILLGYAIQSAHVLNIIWVWGFMLYMNSFQIKPEEAAMKRHFGEAYQTYQKKVRRWI